MTVFFRAQRGRWSYEFQVGGKRHAGYCLEEDGTPCTSRRSAERSEERVRLAAERARRSPAPMPTTTYTLAQALAAYAARADRTKAYWANQRAYIAELLDFFGGETALADITEERIADFVAHARAKPVRVYVGGGVKAAEARKRKLWKETGRTRSDSAINKVLICLRKTLKIAHRTRDAARRRLLDDPPEVVALKTSKRRPRPMGEADFQALMQHAAQHVAEAAALSLLLGFRRGEAFSVTRHQVDFTNAGVWLAAEQTKGDRDEFVPANAPAMQLLRRLVDQAGERGVDHLVTWQARGKGPDGRPKPWRPVKNAKTAIRNAMKKAGLTGRHRFHDVRGAYVTALAHVAPGRVTQKLARHKSFATTSMYIEIADEAARAAVEATANRGAIAGVDLAAPLGKVPTKPPTKPAATPQKRREKVA